MVYHLQVVESRLQLISMTVKKTPWMLMNLPKPTSIVNQPFWVVIMVQNLLQKVMRTLTTPKITPAMGTMT